MPVITSTGSTIIVPVADVDGCKEAAVPNIGSTSVTGRDLDILFLNSELMILQFYFEGAVSNGAAPTGARSSSTGNR